MTQGDFLDFLFKLHPVVVALIVWIWGFGSLIIYGWKTKAIKTVILKSPGIMVGDFFLIPIITFLTVYFYQTVKNPLPAVTTPCWSLTSCLVGIILAAISAVRFRLINRWFFLHIIFYWLMAYIFLTFLTKGFYQLMFGGGTSTLWAIWIFVLVGILIHLVLGVVWRKKFPELE